MEYIVKLVNDQKKVYKEFDSVEELIVELQVILTDEEIEQILSGTDPQLERVVYEILPEEEQLIYHDPLAKQGYTLVNVWEDVV